MGGVCILIVLYCGSDIFNMVVKVVEIGRFKKNYFLNVWLYFVEFIIYKGNLIYIECLEVFCVGVCF